MTRGWKDNALGLTRDQVRLVHDYSQTLRWQIEDAMLSGSTFADAKTAMLKRAPWRGLGRQLEEAVRRVIQSFDLDDLDRRVVGRLDQQRLETLVSHRGKPAGTIERLLYRFTGLLF